MFKLSDKQLITTELIENTTQHNPASYADLITRYGGTMSLSGVQKTAQETPPEIYTFGSTGTSMMSIPMSSAPIAGHKYYGSIMWMTPESTFTTADNRFEWWAGDGANQLMVFANKGSPTNGKWVKLSSIQTLSAPASGTWQIRNFIVNGSTISYCSQMQIVDLTEIFGAGNEPTKEWCDKNIVYGAWGLLSGQHHIETDGSFNSPYHFIEGGRYARYIKISSNGSNMNQLDHISKLYIKNEFEETISLLDATIDFNSMAISGLGIIDMQGQESAYYNIDYASHAVTIDIGYIAFVSAILLRRYYLDSRYYYQNKIEGSLDNTNWFTLYDSGNQGDFLSGNDDKTNVYNETIYGKWISCMSCDTLRLFTTGQTSTNELIEE